MLFRINHVTQIGIKISRKCTQIDAKPEASPRPTGLPSCPHVGCLWCTQRHRTNACSCVAGKALCPSAQAWLCGCVAVWSARMLASIKRRQPSRPDARRHQRASKHAQHASSQLALAAEHAGHSVPRLCTMAPGHGLPSSHGAHPQRVMLGRFCLKLGQ